MDTQRDAVRSLHEGLEKKSAEGKIYPGTRQLLKQKYQNRQQDLDGRFRQYWSA